MNIQYDMWQRARPPSLSPTGLVSNWAEFMPRNDTVCRWVTVACGIFLGRVDPLQPHLQAGNTQEDRPPVWTVTVTSLLLDSMNTWSKMQHNPLQTEGENSLHLLVPLAHARVDKLFNSNCNNHNNSSQSWITVLWMLLSTLYILRLQFPHLYIEDNYAPLLLSYYEDWRRIDQKNTLQVEAAGSKKRTTKKKQTGFERDRNGLKFQLWFLLVWSHRASVSSSPKWTWSHPPQ